MGFDSLERGEFPESRTDLSALLAKTRPAALSSQYELFKTSTRFDGTARNPEWMG